MLLGSRERINAMIDNADEHLRYTGLGAEYATGSFLKARNMCPWDYSGHLFHVDGLIRLDFAPFWFAAGLFFEMLTDRSSLHK